MRPGFDTAQNFRNSEKSGIVRYTFLASLFVSSAVFARPVPVNPAVTPNDPLPARVLDCGGSIIKNVGDRFGGPIGAAGSNGSSVSFTNGGYNVSYDVVDAIKNSRVGDHVMVCLMHIPDPDKCPPGDERGRIYTVTNLRTLESWTLPDSQHMCGGA
jgi:hypothetical protein